MKINRESFQRFQNKAQFVAKRTLTGIDALVNVISPAANAAFKAAPVVRLVVSLWNVVNSTREAVAISKTLPDYKGRAKLLPIGIILSKFGDLFELGTKITGIISAHLQGSAATMQALSLSTTVLGTLAAGFGALIVGVLSADMHVARKEYSTLKGHIKNKSFQQAEESITQERKEMKGLRKIFHPISPKQRETIKSIFTAMGSGNISEKQKVIEKVLHRYKHLKGMKALGIAVAIITIVGMLAVAFAPTPAAAVIWGGIGTALFVTAAQTIAAFIMKKRFEKFLAETEQKHLIT